MILYLLYFYLLGESMATEVTNTPVDISKSVTCYVGGNLHSFNPKFLNLDPSEIPIECEVIIFTQFKIDSLSSIHVDEAPLKAVIDLGKTVIVRISRTNNYNDWGKILSPDGNPAEAKILVEFANKFKIHGFLIENLSPPWKDQNSPFNENVGKNIIPYVKQLKFTPEFIIGIAVDALSTSIKNPGMYNFAELNDLVTFYEIQTYSLNVCRPKLYNGRTPISKVIQGADYLLGMEEVVSFLKESKISLTKMTFDIEVIPYGADISRIISYTQVCKGDYNCASSCIQNTKNLYEKGKFARDQNSGVVIKFLDMDDINNDCGCSTAFIGLVNIIAGFRGGSQTSCAKYDVQSTPFGIQ